MIGKGGRAELIGWETKTARLLPRLLHQRREGPLFLADIAPAPARQPALADLDPVTGRARLSYRRAAEVFKEATVGWTLHQLRHSRLTHLAEAGIALPILMAKSRHTSLSSLVRQTHVRRRRRSHRGHRPRPPALIYPPTAFRSLPPTVCPALQVRVVIETRVMPVEQVLDVGVHGHPGEPDQIARRRGTARKTDDAEDARIARTLPALPGTPV